MNPDPKKKPEQKHHLPSTTKGPVHERRDECSGPPARAVPQSHGRESVVRGLPRRSSEMSKGSPSKRIGVKCQRCQGEDAEFRVFTDTIDVDVCPSCAEVARQLNIATEELPKKKKAGSSGKRGKEVQ